MFSSLRRLARPWFPGSVPTLENDAPTASLEQVGELIRLATDIPCAGSPTDPGVAIRLSQVTKVYPNGSRGLYQVNIEVRKGDFLFITGSSGAGKSTLLKLLYGAERPTSGEVRVEDVLLNGLHGRKLAYVRRRIGVVFQDYKLIPRRTVEENVAFVLRAQGFARNEVRRRLGPTLRMVGLAHKAECFPEQLSGGEQQRVSIARAIVHTPRLLIADEPTGNLDQENAWTILQILQQLHQVGVTVVVACHNEQIVQSFARRVVQLEAGTLRELTNV
ncbi:MAG: cell division ATP-binding protein FtsE [Gemmatimonadaceae bacterium]|nr:cell division ATP-binding protein FtsE [Gloeobacterales cyanobacterium ES-bin-141]